jgi:hypothetical protein
MTRLEATAAPPNPLAGKLHDAWQRHDADATRHQKRRLTFAAFAAALGPLAVLLLAAQALLFPHGGPAALLLIAGELAVLALALTLAFVRFGRAHERWITARLRAEALRREEFLLLARVGPYLETEPGEHDVGRRLLLIDAHETDPVELLELHDPERGSWWNGLMEAWHAGSAGARVDVPKGLETYLRERIDDQRRYFDSKGEQHAGRARRWENAAKVVLVLALVVAALHFGALLGAPEGGGRHPEGLVLLAIVLPPVGSAIVGLLSILGSHRLSRAYRYNARILQRLQHEGMELAREAHAGTRSEDVLAYEFKRLVLRTEELLSDDLRQWWIVMKPEAPRPGA